MKKPEFTPLYSGAFMGIVSLGSDGDIVGYGFICTAGALSYLEQRGQMRTLAAGGFTIKDSK